MLSLLLFALFGQLTDQPTAHHERRIHQLLEQLGVPTANLEERTLLWVEINPEQRVKVHGRARPLLEKGWSTYLVRIDNAAGTTAPLHVRSPQALPLAEKRWNDAWAPQPQLSEADLQDRWLELQPYGDWKLSGLSHEYRILQLYSRDAGPRAATFQVDCGQGTQDLGFRAEADLLFQCRPARHLTLDVQDERGPCMASFTVRDAQGNVYPPKTKRLAPDFFFQPQVYRQSGETLDLPDGDYQLQVRHGPEYRVLHQPLHVAGDSRLSVRLQRWIDPSPYRSCDPHIHAAGCAHYSDPTQGVTPDTMWRHIQGESL